MAAVNMGTIEGAHVGTVKSKEELMTKLEALQVSPERAEQALAEFDAKANQKPEEKKAGKGKTLFDKVRGMME
jgi:hypothetical protein